MRIRLLLPGRTPIELATAPGDCVATKTEYRVESPAAAATG